MKRKPKLGQNFLVDQAAARTIVDALGDLSDATVVEIGPGHGAITALLASRAERLICVELDRALAAELRFRYRDAKHVTIVEADILTVDLTTLWREATANASGKAPGRLRVVGNLPYYITSDILLHLCTHAAAIDIAVVMMQREVADRVAAAPCHREYGVLSVTVQRYADVNSLLTLPPAAFAPPPEVFSTVLRLAMQHGRSAALGITDEAAFTRLVRSAFAQKRKTLANNLRGAGFSTDEIRAGCATAQVGPELRAEALSLEQLARLHRALADARPETLSFIED